MTDAYFYPRWAEQEGWAQASTQTFTVDYFGGTNVDPGREFITRFFDVDLPSGATITAASVVYSVHVKNTNDPQSFTYDHFFEATATGGGTVRQDATPLRIGVAEEDTANRTWTSHLTSQTFTWNNGVGHAENQDLLVNVTTLIQQVFNTNAGRHCALAFKLKVLTDGGDHAIGNNAYGHKISLLIQYTGGTARNEVVTANENSNFALVSASGAPSLWVNNTVFGAYQNSPTYATTSNPDGLTAPQGGNVFKITSTEDNKRAIAWHLDPNDLQWGQWYCFSAFVYVPIGVSDVKITNLQTVFNDTGRFSTKNTWVRLYVPYLVGPDRNPLLGIGTIDTMMTGQSFYVANVNFTKGNHLYPYYDGATTDTATFHRTFDWGGGTTGTRSGGVAYVTLDNAPSATANNPQQSGSTQKSLTIRWAYSDPYSEAQARYRIEARKKRVP